MYKWLTYTYLRSYIKIYQIYIRFVYWSIDYVRIIIIRSYTYFLMPRIYVLRSYQKSCKLLFYFFPIFHCKLFSISIPPNPDEFSQFFPSHWLRILYRSPIGKHTKVRTAAIPIDFSKMVVLYDRIVGLPAGQGWIS